MPCVLQVGSLKGSDSKLLAGLEVCVGFLATLTKYLADDCNPYRRFRRPHTAGTLLSSLVAGGTLAPGRRGLAFGKPEAVWRVCRTARLSALLQWDPGDVHSYLLCLLPGGWLGVPRAWELSPLPSWSPAVVLEPVNAEQRHSFFHDKPCGEGLWGRDWASKSKPSPPTISIHAGDQRVAGD